jgi:hypothetical protein
MKKILIFLLFCSNYSFAQVIVGGGGICHVDSDPNTIVSIATQNQGGCKRALNTVNGFQYYYDDTRVAGQRWLLEQRNIYETRTIPVVANDIVNIGTFTITNAGANLEIDINYQGTGFARNKQYLLAINNNFGAGVWRIVQPINQTLIEAIPAFQANLLIRQSGSTVYDLAIQRIAGAAATTAYINIGVKGLAQGITFAASSTTATIANVATQYVQTGTVLPNLHTYNSNFSVSTEHQILRCNPTAFMVATIPLPANVPNKVYTFVNLGTSALTISSPFRVANGTTATTIAAGVRATIMSDGVEWFQIY